MLTAILHGIVALVSIVVETIIRLSLEFIINWFQDREKLKNSDKDNIAFTIQEKVKNKEYKTVQGIFNKRTNEVVEAQEIHSNQLDRQIQELHRDNELVIYE
ncbi:MAG: hypothetical protein AAF915_17515 [Cyanobacteria bacterium P01_D01_bin.50]